MTEKRYYRDDLSGAASWLYHNDIKNPLMIEINAILDTVGLSSRTLINRPLSDEVIEVIEKVKQLAIDEQKERAEAKRKNKLRKKRR